MKKPKNKALKAVYRKGKNARDNGIPMSRNPFNTSHRGCVSASKAFRKWWKNGWQDRDKEIKLAVVHH